MKYQIGNIVKYINETNELKRFVVVATKENPLTEKFLKDSKTLNFAKEKELANYGVYVNSGFDYKIANIEKVDGNNNWIFQGSFIDANEDEIFIP